MSNTPYTTSPGLGSLNMNTLKSTQVASPPGSQRGGLATGGEFDDPLGIGSANDGGRSALVLRSMLIPQNVPSCVLCSGNPFDDDGFAPSPGTSNRGNPTNSGRVTAPNSSAGGGQDFFGAGAQSWLTWPIAVIECSHALRVRVHSWQWQHGIRWRCSGESRCLSPP